MIIRVLKAYTGSPSATSSRCAGPRAQVTIRSTGLASVIAAAILRGPDGDDILHELKATHSFAFLIRARSDPMMPKQNEIEIPLLQCLVELGGTGKPQEIYPRVTTYFTNLTEAERTERLPSGGNKWKNRIQWVRQTLVSRGEMDSPEYGVWEITEKGKNRLASQSHPVMPPEAPKTAPETKSVTAANLEEMADEYLAAFKQKVLQKLQDLSPSQFERFAGALLSAYGFTDVSITGRAGDGGIDGHGKLRVGLASMNVAFQCKRWQGVVGRPEIDKFRGAIQGEFEQGIFFTTSDFSDQAQGVSIKKGATPVVLLNGDAIVGLMVEKGLGIQRRPIEVYEDQIESLFEEEA